MSGTGVANKPADIPINKDDLVPYIIDRYPIYATPMADHFDYQYYDIKNVKYISDMCTNLLKGTHPDKKNIIVSDKDILSVMESIFENNPRVSTNIKTKMVIAYIVDAIKTEYETIEQNNKLDVEVIKYDGSYGIRKVSPVKTRNKRPTPFLFNMHY